jgi:hypothetical protein
VVAVHSRLHLGWGTDRTVEGWWSRDAVERTLAAGTSSSTGDRSLAAYAGRLRSIAQAITAQPQPAAPTSWRSFDPARPYSTAELAQLLDDAEAMPNAATRQRLLMLTWLGTGTGVTVAEQTLLSPPCFTLTPTALLLDVPGPTARRIPVRHECEQPLLELLADLPPDSSLYQGLPVGAKAIGLVGIRAARGPHATRVTATRLRATWSALVLSGPVPMGPMLASANILGEKILGGVARSVHPGGAQDAVHALRGSSEPLLPQGQLLLPGLRHPAPHVPLLPQPGESR